MYKLRKPAGADAPRHDLRPEQDGAGRHHRVSLLHPPFHLNDPRDPAARQAGVYHWTPDVRDYNDAVQEQTFQMSGLDDLDTENPKVRQALRRSYGYWISEVGVDAFLCPGHASMVLGASGYRGIAEKYGVPCVNGDMRAFVAITEPTGGSDPRNNITTRAVRDGRWKLVGFFGGPWELYDVEADRSEARDLSAREPEQVSRLAKAYEEWAARVGVVPWTVASHYSVYPNERTSRRVLYNFDGDSCLSILTTSTGNDRNT